MKDKFVLDSNQKLHEGIYLHQIDSARFKFYRFYQNGRVFASVPYCNMPDSTEFNDTWFGWKGYYKLQGEKLLLEFYSDRYSGLVVSEFVVKENEIIQITYKPTGLFTVKFKFPIPDSYFFVPVIVHDSPDW